ncbi:MAG: hypothetical protein LBT53_04545 [Puniceicoccales bacterium]|jgi:hypothetical protein|nr:hypothetical protein [Puniceicoccales bacterium]
MKLSPVFRVSQVRSVARRCHWSWREITTYLALAGAAAQGAGCAGDGDTSNTLVGASGDATAYAGLAAATALATPAVVLGAATASVAADKRPTNKGSTGRPLTQAEYEKLVSSTPVEQRSALGHYNDDRPELAADARLVPNTQLDWVTLSIAPFYIFDSGLDLHHHSGFGAVFDFAFVQREQKDGWFGTLSGDLLAYRTTAEARRSGSGRHETIFSGSAHANIGGGVRWKGLEMRVYAGSGLGGTHSEGTAREDKRPHKVGGTLDVSVQGGGRIAISPTEQFCIFTGYRWLWNTPLGTSQKAEQIMQSIEAGVTFRF